MPKGSNTINSIAEAAARFSEVFGGHPQIVARAPGRVNLIGEHTDYNDGWVLPFAIEPSVVVAAGRGEGATIRIDSCAFNESVEFPLDVDVSSATQRWQNYIRSVVAGLHGAGITLRASNLLISGDLPSGGGLSSSAALCVATSLALLRLHGSELPPLDVARLCRDAEHRFAGTPCGIMDPYVSLFGKRDHALLIDCRSETHKCVPLALPGHSLMVLNTGVTHELAMGSLARRVFECREAVAAIAKTNRSVVTLRDLSESALSALIPGLDPLLGRRARHIVSEMARVLDAVEALRTGQVAVLGRLLNESHASLRDNYEVSCDEVEDRVNVLRDMHGVIGARMVGGGFGGSILALVEEDCVSDVRKRLTERSFTLRESEPMEVTAADGAWCGEFP